MKLKIPAKVFVGLTFCEVSRPATRVKTPNDSQRIVNLVRKKKEHGEKARAEGTSLPFSRNVVETRETTIEEIRV